MSNRLRHFRQTLTAAALAAALAAPLALTVPGVAVAQERGGTMNIIVQPEPPILVLGLNQQGPTQTVAGKIYQGLLTFGFDLKPQPELAESWEVSPDGKVYTFKLVKNAKWHDGKPFTAHDVVFSTSKFLMETHPRARATFSKCEKIEALDDHTVQFTLKEPFGPFLQAFEVSSAPMMPKHIYEGTDFKANPANATPIGTGPFKFKEWNKGSYIHLVRNDEYWKAGKPYLDDIYFRVIPDAASRAVAVEQGTVQQTQFNDIETFDVPRLKGLPNVEMTTKGYEFFAPLSWIEINTRNKPLDDKRFRQAMMHAIDRKFIRDKIWFGLGRPATGPVNSVTRFHEANVKKYDFDPKKAEALLEEAGYKKGADGTRAKVRLLVMPYGETWTRLGEYVKQAMKRVGVDVTLETTDAAGWVNRVSNWDYDLSFNFVYQYGDPALGVTRTYVSENIRKGVMFSNTMGYSNPEVDKLFAQAAQTNKDDERQQLYSAAQKILVEDVPVAWLLEMEFPTFVDKRFKNAVTTAIGVNESYDSVYMVKK
ncbi:ABC transporter substrate-binding protein [Azospirillum brasilense]|uniref:ABC transporter substrate-binding protein n=1 Tax=Azospirillum brasilense TaxID=192 RepID=UPI001EDBBBAD|nr:ABC transporter substrate-binding protein [Azospirillum brasilense]UKJ77080.1 ABC transporter substrate-binding protein [Azospirillum brasilense]